MCAFVNDLVDRATLTILKAIGIKIIAIRAVGYDHVDLKSAEELGIAVVHVPAYSPHAIAEHAAALLLTLARKIHISHMQVNAQNFSLEGLMGLSLFGKTVGVVGTGHIGAAFAKIMLGFGCRVLVSDPVENPDLKNLLGLSYVTLEEILTSSDVISLHLPLNKKTYHHLDAHAFQTMKPGAIVINTGRGGLIDTQAMIDALKSGHLGGAGLDVVEGEDDFFFKDCSAEIILDDRFIRLKNFPNVLITPHQAFLTAEAMTKIVEVTLQNFSDFENGQLLLNEIRFDHLG